MRKRIFPLLSLLLLLAAVLCGCQGKEADDGTSGAGLTKGEWVGLLGRQFGYNAYENTADFYSDVSPDNENYDEIQACAEWEILPENGSLHPQEPVTWRYAVETCVRAIGLEKLNASEAGIKVTEENLVDFFAGNIAKIDMEALDSQLSESDAELMLTYANDYAANLSLAERFDYTYNEEVKEVSPEAIILKGDGETALIRDGSTYEAGDVIYIQPSDDEPARAIRVKSADGKKITYEEAGMEDVYEELHIMGTFEGTVIQVEPAEGVTVNVGESASGQSAKSAIFDANTFPASQSMEYLGRQQKKRAEKTNVTAGNGTVNFSKDLGEGVTLNAVISDIKISPDVDFTIFSGLKKANVTLSFQDKVTAAYTQDHVSKQIPLGKISVVLGTTPFTAEFSLVANLGFDGKITLTYSSQVVAQVNYSAGKGLCKSVSNNNAQCDFHADATVTVEPCIKAELCCFGRGLVNVKVTSGVVAIANVDIDLLGDNPACIDVLLYVPLRWAVNEDGCVMTAISSKLKASSDVWNSENSPVRQRFHWEDGELVEACTRGEKKVETASVDEGGQPYDEYHIFNFEEIVFGVIKVASQKLYLAEGETMSIGIISLPDGCSVSDLRYTVENSSVCAVADGSVSAVGHGSTVVRISTVDGKYSVFLTVVVAEEYNDTSGFESL